MLCTVATEGPIIGYTISGPISTPVELSELDVRKMLRRGYEIYCHNPVNTRDKVKVTMKNINRIKFDTAEAVKSMVKIEKEIEEAAPIVVDVVHREEEHKNSKKNKKKDWKNNYKVEKSKEETPELEDVVNKSDDFEK